VPIAFKPARMAANLRKCQIIQGQGNQDCTSNPIGERLLGGDVRWKSAKEL